MKSYISSFLVGHRQTKLYSQCCSKRAICMIHVSVQQTRPELHQELGISKDSGFVTTLFLALFLSSFLFSLLALFQSKNQQTHIFSIPFFKYKCFSWLPNIQKSMAHRSRSNLHLHLSLGFKPVLALGLEHVTLKKEV